MRHGARLLFLSAFVVLLPGCPASEPCGAAVDAAAACGEPAPVLLPDVICGEPGCPAPSCDCSAAADCPAAVDADFCALWDRADPTAADVASLRRFGLSRATAVLEGTFGAPEDTDQGTYAPFVIENVRFGWSFLAGMEVRIRVPPDVAAGFVTSPRWLVALNSNRPSGGDAGEPPPWGNLLALVPAAEAADYAPWSGYRVEGPNAVAVVRIAEQDGERTRFEVVDALRGTFPLEFRDNWYASWNLPYPGVGDDTWIATVHGLTEYPETPEGSVFVGTVRDFRPATTANIHAVKQVLAQPPVWYDRDALRARRQALHDGLRFYRAPFVVSSVVTGLAEECCTGLGGTFVAHEIVEALAGDPGVDRFVLGGHGYYGEERCGDGFLHGLTAITPLDGVVEDDFDCLAYPAIDSWDAYGPAISSGASVRRPYSPAARDEILAWLNASPPLYQLRRADDPAPATLAAQDPANAPWSLPLDATETFLLGTHIVLFAVEDAQYDETRDRHTVRVSTTYSLHEYDHLHRHELALDFRCGDPRLGEVGSRWIGAFVLLDPWSIHAEEGPGLDRAYLVPGALIPESALSPQLAHELERFLTRE